MSITRITYFEAKGGMATELREFLVAIVPLIEQSEGCESCQLLQNQEKQEEFVVLENWSSKDTHRASVKNIPPEKSREIMSLLASPPSGSYFSPTA